MHSLASAGFFSGGQRQNFAYPFQAAHDAMQMDVHKMLYSSIPLSVLVELQFSIFCLKCFLHFDYQKCFFFS